MLPRAGQQAEFLGTGTIGRLRVDRAVPVEEHRTARWRVCRAEMEFGLRDARVVYIVDAKRMWGLPERGRIAEVHVAFVEQGVSLVIVPAKHEADPAVRHKGGLEALGLPVRVRIAAHADGRDEIVLEMDLRPRVVVVQRGEKPFALRTHPLGKVVVHFVVEKDQDAMACNLKLRGQVAVDPVKGSGMVVVCRTGTRPDRSAARSIPGRDGGP